MNARKKVNKNHPDYPAYLEKCKAIWAVYEPQVDAVEKKGRKEYPDWRGKDSPWGDELREIMRDFHTALKKLQEEYAHLFTEDIDDER